MVETFLCPNCGSENLMHHRFCGNCGARLAAREQMVLKRCPRCGITSPPEFKFCTDCGAVLDLHCPNCGAVVPSDSRYCPKCAYLCGEGRYSEI
jgi:predicted RNA-binding Zn-ribbon protein involved in translation (DUF1610 family)